MKELNINQGNLNTPIFDLKISLDNRRVQFEPSIESNARKNGIRDVINQIVADFISLATKMPRLDSTGQAAGDFLVEIRDQFELFSSIQKVSNSLNDMEKLCGDFLNAYDNFRFLWEEELDEAFDKFIATGVDVREQFQKELEKAIEDEQLEEVQIEERKEFFEAMVRKIFNGVATRQPSLQQFDEQINHLVEIKEKIKQMQESNSVGWLKVDSLPIKEKLTQTIQFWIEKYTGFLLTNFKQKLKNIETWTNDVKEGTAVLPTKEIEKFKRSETEKRKLIVVMTHLRDVKQIREGTMKQFPSMKETYLTLKKHADQFAMDNVDFNVKLETAKVTLTEVADRAMRQVKESILPLQKMEGDNVKERREKFLLEVKNFRFEFVNNVPRDTQQSSPEIINNAYLKISEYYVKLKEIEKKRDHLQNEETLFDLERSFYKELRDCYKEL